MEPLSPTLQGSSFTFKTKIDNKSSPSASPSNNRNTDSMSHRLKDVNEIIEESISQNTSKHQLSQRRSDEQEFEKKMEFINLIPISVSDFIALNPLPIRQVYKIGKLIGQGSYGDVRLIIHR